MTKLVILKFALSSVGAGAVVVTVVPAAVVLQEKNANNPNNLLSSAVSSINKSNITAKPNIQISSINSDTIGSDIVGLPVLPNGLKTQFENIKMNPKTGQTTFQIGVVAPNGISSISKPITVQFETPAQASILQNIINSINNSKVAALPNILITDVSKTQSFANQITGMPAIPDGMTFTYQNIVANNQSGSTSFDVLVTDSNGNTAISSTITAAGFVTANEEQIVNKVVDDINGATISANSNTSTTGITSSNIAQHLSGLPTPQSGTTYHFQDVNVDPTTGQTTFKIAVTGANGATSISKVITVNFQTPAQATSLQNIVDQINKATITADPNVLTANISKTQTFASQIQGMPAVPSGMTFTYQNISVNVSNNEATFDVLVTDSYGHTMTSANITATGFETTTEASGISKVVDGINNATITAKLNVEVSTISASNIDANITGVPSAPSNMTYKYINVVPNASTGVTTFNIQVVGPEGNSANSKTISVVFETTVEQSNITNIINSINNGTISAKPNVEVSTINQVNIGANINGVPALPNGFKMQYQNINTNLGTGVTTFTILITGPNGNSSSSKTLSVTFETPAQASVLADIIKQINKSTVIAVPNTLTTNVSTTQSFSTQITGMPVVPTGITFTYQNIVVNNSSGNVTFDVLVTDFNGNNAISSTITATGFVTASEQQVVTKSINDINGATISANPNTSTTGITSSNIAQHLNGLPTPQSGTTYHFQDVNVDPITGQTTFKIAVTGANGATSVSKTITVNFQTPTQASSLQDIINSIQESVVSAQQNVLVTNVSKTQSFANQIKGMPSVPSGMTFTYQNISVNQSNGEVTFDVLVTDSYGHTMTTSNIVASGFETTIQQNNINDAIDKINSVTISAKPNINISSINQSSISENIIGVPNAPTGMSYQYENLVTSSITGAATFNIQVTGPKGNTSLSKSISVIFETPSQANNIANAISAIKNATISAKPNTLVSTSITDDTIAANINGVPNAPTGMSYQYINVKPNLSTGVTTFNIVVTGPSGNNATTSTISVNFETLAQVLALKNIIDVINKATITALANISTTEILENQGFANQITGIPAVPSGMTFTYQNITNNNSGSVSFDVLVTDANGNTQTSTTITATGFITASEQQIIDQNISNINGATISAKPNTLTTGINDQTIANNIIGVPNPGTGMTYTYKNVSVDSSNGVTTFNIVVSGVGGASSTSKTISVNFETPTQATALQNAINAIQEAAVKALPNILITNVLTTQGFANQITGMPDVPSGMTFTYQNITTDQNNGQVTFNVLVTDANGHTMTTDNITAAGFETTTEQSNINNAVDAINSSTTISALPNINIVSINQNNISTNITGVPNAPKGITYKYENVTTNSVTGVATFNIEVIGPNGNNALSNPINVTFETATEASNLTKAIDAIKAAVANIVAKPNVLATTINNDNIATNISGVPNAPEGMTYKYINTTPDSTTGITTFNIQVVGPKGNTANTPLISVTFETVAQVNALNSVVNSIKNAKITALSGITTTDVVETQAFANQITGLPSASINKMTYIYSNFNIDNTNGQVTFNVLVTDSNGNTQTATGIIATGFVTVNEQQLVDKNVSEINGATISAKPNVLVNDVTSKTIGQDLIGLPSPISGMTYTYQISNSSLTTGIVSFNIVVSSTNGATGTSKEINVTFETSTQVSALQTITNSIETSKILAVQNTLVSNVLTTQAFANQITGMPDVPSGMTFTYQNIKPDNTNGNVTFDVLVTDANGNTIISTTVTATGFITSTEQTNLANAVKNINEATINAKPNVLVSSIKSSNIADNITGVPTIPNNMTYTYANVISNSITGVTTFNIVVNGTNGNTATSKTISVTFETSTEQANINNAINNIDIATISAKPNVLVSLVKSSNIADNITGVPVVPTGMSYNFINFSSVSTTGVVTFNIEVVGPNGNSNTTKTITVSFETQDQADALTNIINKINKATVQAISGISTTSVLGTDGFAKQITGMPAVPSGMTFTYQDFNINNSTGKVTFDVLVTDANKNTQLSGIITATGFINVTEQQLVNKNISDINTATISAKPNTLISGITNANIDQNIIGVPNALEGVNYKYNVTNIDQQSGKVTFTITATGTTGATETSNPIIVNFETQDQVDALKAVINSIETAAIKAEGNILTTAVSTTQTFANQITGMPIIPKGISIKYQNISINSTNGDVTFNILVTGPSGNTSETSTLTATGFITSTEQSNMTNAINAINSATISATPNILVSTITTTNTNIASNITGVPNAPTGMTYKYINVTPNISTGITTFNIEVINTNGYSSTSKVISVNFETTTEQTNINNAISAINKATISAKPNTPVANINASNLSENIIGVPSVPNGMKYSYENVVPNLTTGQVTFNIQVAGPQGNSEISSTISVNFETPAEATNLANIIKDINKAKVIAVAGISTSAVDKTQAFANQITGMPAAINGMNFTYQNIIVNNISGNVTFDVLVTDASGNTAISATITATGFVSASEQELVNKAISDINGANIKAVPNTSSTLITNSSIKNYLQNVPTAPSGISYTYQNVKINSTTGLTTFTILVTGPGGITGTSNSITVYFETPDQANALQAIINQVEQASVSAVPNTLATSVVKTQAFANQITGMPTPTNGITFTYQNIDVNLGNGEVTFNVVISDTNGISITSGQIIATGFVTATEQDNVATAVNNINTANIKALPNTPVSGVNSNNISTNITGVPNVPLKMSYKYIDFNSTSSTGNVTFKIVVTGPQGNNDASNTISVNFESEFQLQALQNIIAKIKEATVVAVSGISTTDVSLKSQIFATQITGMPTIPQGMTFTYQDITNNNSGNVTFNVLVTDSNGNSSTSATITATGFVNATEQQNVNKIVDDINGSTISAKPNTTTFGINDQTIGANIIGVPTAPANTTFTYSNVNADSASGQTTFNIIVTGENGATATSKLITVNFETQTQINNLHTIVAQIQNANIQALSGISTNAVKQNNGFAEQISGMPTVKGITFTYQDFKIDAINGQVTFDVIVSDSNGNTATAKSIIAYGFVTGDQQNIIDQNINNINNATISAIPNTLTTGINNDTIAKYLENVPTPTSGITFTYQNVVINASTGQTTFYIKASASDGANGLSNKKTVQFETPAQATALQDIINQINKAKFTAIPNTLVSDISTIAKTFETQITGMPSVPSGMTFTYENIVNENNGNASFSILVSDTYGNTYTSSLITATGFETSTQVNVIAAAIKAINDATITANINVLVSSITTNNTNIATNITGVPNAPSGLSYTYTNVDPNLSSGVTTFNIIVKDANGNSATSKTISVNFVSPDEEINLNKVVDEINNATIVAKSNTLVSTINKSNIAANITGVPNAPSGFKYEYINVVPNQTSGTTTFNIEVISSNGNIGTSKTISVNFESPAQSDALDSIIKDIEKSTITAITNTATSAVSTTNSQAFSTQINGMPAIPIGMSFTYQNIKVNSNSGNVTFNVLVTDSNNNTATTSTITATGFVTSTEQQTVYTIVDNINAAKIKAIPNTPISEISDSTIVNHITGVPTPISGITYQYKYVSISSNGQTTFKIQVNGANGAMGTSNLITVQFETPTQANALANIINEIQSSKITAVTNTSTASISQSSQDFAKQILGMPSIPSGMTFTYQNIQANNSAGEATFKVLVSDSFGNSSISTTITATGFETPTELDNINNAINNINNATNITANNNVLVSNISDSNIGTNISGVPPVPEGMTYKYINVNGSDSNGTTTFNIEVVGPKGNSRTSNQITVHFETQAQLTALTNIVNAINTSKIIAVLNTSITAVSKTQTFASQITGMPSIPNGMTFTYQNISPNITAGTVTFDVLITDSNGHTVTSNTITAIDFVSPSEQDLVNKVTADINGANIIAANANVSTNGISDSNIANHIINVPSAPSGISYKYQNVTIDPITGQTTFNIVVTGADGATDTSKTITVNFISPDQSNALNNIIGQIQDAHITGLPTVAIANIFQNYNFSGQIQGMPAIPSGMTFTYQDFNVDIPNGSVTFKVVVSDAYGHSMTTNTLTATNFQTAAQTAALQNAVDTINKTKITPKPNISISDIDQNYNFINQVIGMPTPPSGMTFTYQDFTVSTNSGVVTFSILVTDAQGHSMLSNPLTVSGFVTATITQAEQTFIGQLKAAHFVAVPNTLTTSVYQNQSFSSQFTGMPFIPSNISIQYQDITPDSNTGIVTFKLLITVFGLNNVLSPALSAINFETPTQLSELKNIVNGIDTNNIKAVPNSPIGYVDLVNLPSKLTGQPVAPNGYTYQYVDFSSNGTTGVATFSIKVTNSQGNYFTTTPINVTFLSPAEQQLLNNTISTFQNASWSGISTLLVTSPQIISDLANNINGTPSVPSGWTIAFKDVSLATNAQYNGGITFKVLLTDELGNTILSSDITVYGYQTILTKTIANIKNADISPKTNFTVTKDLSFSASNILNYINIPNVTIPANINMIATDFTINTTTGLASFNIQLSNEGGVEANTGQISITFTYYPTLNTIANFAHTLVLAGSAGTFNVSSYPLLLGQFQPAYLQTQSDMSKLIGQLGTCFVANNYNLPTNVSVMLNVKNYAWKQNANTSSSGVSYGNGEIQITLQDANYPIEYQTDWIAINTINLGTTSFTNMLTHEINSNALINIPWILPSWTSPAPNMPNNSQQLANYVMGTIWWQNLNNGTYPFLSLIAQNGYAQTYNPSYWSGISFKVSDVYFSGVGGGEQPVGSGYLTITIQMNIFGQIVSSQDLVGKMIVQINPNA